MAIKLFKPENFRHIVHKEIEQQMADHCNAILQREVEKWPVVLQYKEGITSHWNTVDVLGRPDNHTHTARLAFIEEIKKEPCKEHDPTKTQFDLDVSDTGWKCQHCGVKLVAEWKEA